MAPDAEGGQLPRLAQGRSSGFVNGKGHVCVADCPLHLATGGDLEIERLSGQPVEAAQMRTPFLQPRCCAGADFKKRAKL
jgi:hypothetical protein